MIPDAAVRVLLLDFDTLPTKLSEALPIVRFRLKKLIPFEADDAMVSFQVMSTSRSMVRVLAVAIPRDVLAEYESAAREAGFEPGAVLPSTLASLAALQEGEGASLVVNASAQGVTTAIVRAGILLLHRAIELNEPALPTPANLPAALFEGSTATPTEPLLPLVDRHATEAEWAAQEPLPEHGRNPYADRASTEAATQDEDAVTGMPLPAGIFLQDAPVKAPEQRLTQPIDMYAANEAAPPSRSPYASAALQSQLSAEFHQATLASPTGLSAFAEPQAEADAFPGAPIPSTPDREPPTYSLTPDVQADEIARAVSVAIAYFEDSLSAAPEVLLSAGPFGAERLNRLLREQGIADGEGVRVRELVDAAALAPGAVSSTVPRGSLAGVAGALNS